MTSPKHLLKFSKSARLRSRLDFAAVYADGIRISDDCLSMSALSNDRATTRLGLAVSKRYGNAVERNGFKRRVREVFRSAKSELPSGMDFVVQPRTNSPVEVGALRKSLISLLRRAARKLAAKKDPRTTDAEIVNRGAR